MSVRVSIRHLRNRQRDLVQCCPETGSVPGTVMRGASVDVDIIPVRI